MRIWIAIVVAVGCSKVDNKHARELPRPVGFAKMSPEARCAATAPRARPCHNELLSAQMRDVGLSDTGINDKPVSDDEAEALQRNTCLGSPGYAPAMIECWDQPSCGELAKCTLEHAAKLDAAAAAARHGSDVPLDMDEGSGSDVPLTPPAAGSGAPHHKVEITP